MQLRSEDIIEAAGRVITLSGTQALTLDSLAEELGLAVFELTSHIQNEEGIFELLLLQLEIELKGLISEVSSKNEQPPAELEMFFKKLHGLFAQKPYYLIVVFDEHLHHRFRNSLRTISKIEGIERVAKGYLTNLIKRGKEEKMFSTAVSTKVLVDNILGSFQTLMSDMQIAEKMIWDLKKVKATNN